MLDSGSIVELRRSQVGCVVEKLLGEGGQGAVFEARTSVPGRHRPGSALDDQRVALKWYLPGSATNQQWELLSDLVDREPPHERFLWPLDLATARDVPGFGYVMPLRPQGYFGMVDLVTGRVDVAFRQLATMGLELAHSFLLLHTKGLCYRDINFGNVFFNPEDGAVLICDTDNVGIDGDSPGNVWGTPYFMAPEVMRGESPPSTTSDQFSLAVLLFYMFMVHHPLEGARALEFEIFDRDAMMQLFARDPVFIYDPDDASNRPVPGHHDTVITYWPLYPRFLRELFITAFTAGLRNPGSRVWESTWRSAMMRLRDAVVFCPSCAKQNFFDEEAAQATCWACHRVIPRPLRLRIGRQTVVLTHDAKLYPHHLRLTYDFSAPIASVVRHPQHPNRWGLRNLTSEPWTAVQADGTTHEVAAGRSVQLLPRLTLRFTEGVEGLIVHD